MILLIAFTKLLIISAIVGVVLFLVFSSVKWLLIGFTLSIVIHFIITWLINRIENYKFKKFLHTQELDNQAIIEANTTELRCVACSEVHRIPLIISNRNTFKCKKCGIENVVYITCETATVTNIKV